MSSPDARLQEYENAIEGMDEMFTVVDRDYRYLVANRAFLRYRGFERQNLIGRRVPDVLHPRMWALAKRYLDECFDTGRVVTYESQYEYPALGIRDLLVSYFPIEGPDGINRIACILRDVTDRKRTERALDSLSGQLLRMEDEGRRRLARNLHDTTAQHLAALSLNLSVASAAMGAGDTRGHRALSESIALADLCLREIRTVSYLLHPPELDALGLQPALVRYIEGFSQRSSIAVELTASPDIERLPREIETAIFRIVQECLTNIHRHSGSPTAVIRFDRTPHGLHLEVRDAGRGMTSAATPGIGLTSMHERAHELRGRINIRSDEGGTVVAVTIPLDGSAP